MKKLLILYLFSFSLFAQSEKKLPISEYISQVKQNNEGIRSAINSSDGSFTRAKSAELILSPYLFTNIQGVSDSRPTLISAFQGTKTTSQNFSFGISKMMDFGLNGKLYYDVWRNAVTGANPLYLTTPSYFTSRVVLELSQPIWKNGFGREVRLNLQASESAAKANSYGNVFKVKMTIAESEGAYWRLTIAREVLNLEKLNVARAKRILEWQQRRVRLRLAENADLLQSEVLFRARELQLQNAIDEEKLASISFNQARGVDSDSVEETLQQIEPQLIQQISTPVQISEREDLKASKELTAATIAQSKIFIEKTRPQLDVFASASLNGKSDNFAINTSQAFSGQHPFFAVGLTFSMPLDFKNVSDTKKGYAIEIDAAELSLKRKIFEHDLEWKTLNTTFDQAKKRYETAVKLEELYKTRSDVEWERLKKGRTTTFQALVFEQDYATSQLSRIKAQGDCLLTSAKLKTFASVQ